MLFHWVIMTTFTYWDRGVDVRQSASWSWTVFDFHASLEPIGCSMSSHPFYSNLLTAGDLKSKNVLLTKYGTNAKLSDVGMSRVLATTLNSAVSICCLSLKSSPIFQLNCTAEPDECEERPVGSVSHFDANTVQECWLYFLILWTVV